MELKKDDFIAYRKRITALAESIPDATEEATKNAFVMPLLSLLGYDVFNPMEVIPEYTCDYGTKKGEKVDYAIMRDGEPIILLEAKRLNLKLQKNQQNQLYRYFSISRARVAILTNGIEYRLYSDMNTPNIMDDEPFITLNVLEGNSDSVVQILSQLCKGNFSMQSITNTALLSKFAKVVEYTVAEDLQKPSDSLMRYFLSRPDFKLNSKITSKMIETYRPVATEILKKMMGATIQQTTIKEVTTQQTTIIPSNSLENQYGYLVNDLKGLIGENISADYTNKSGILNIDISRNGNKYIRLRMSMIKSERFDVTFFSPVGTKQMFLCNSEQEVKDAVKSHIN